MKKLSILLLALTTSVAVAAPALTTKKTIKGNDDRGSYDIDYVQLTPAFKNKVVRDRVNLDLKRFAREQRCEPNRQDRKHMYSNLTMDVSVMNDSVLAVEYTYDNFCMGAHPNNGPGASIYDLRNGKMLDVETEARDGQALRRLVVEKIIANKDAEVYEECKFLYGQEELTSGYYVYTLKKEGLQVTPDFPHVAKACAYDTIIPYGDVLPLVKDGSALESLR